MARKRVEEQQDEIPEVSQANPQRPIWMNFDHCWSSCVKNGNDLLKEAAKAHLRSIGKWEDQTQWVSGLTHFGIPIEK